MYSFLFFSVALSTQRRSERRKRAAARRRWWLHKHGHIRLSASQLHHLRATLAKHHSRDLTHLRLISLEMNADWDGPWRCSSCMKTNGKKAAFCDRCGDSWRNGTPHKSQPQPEEAPGWTYNRWSDWQNQAQQNWEKSSSSSRSSSRKHQPKPKTARRPRRPKGNNAQPNRGRGKGRKGQGRGDGQPSALPLPPPPAPPPWPTIDRATSLVSAVNTVPVADSTTTAATQQLQADNREFARLLRDAYPDAQTRPPEATAAIERAEQGMTKNVTKSLHSATKALDKAQKLLAEAAEARRVHRNSWLAHLSESIKTWETQLETYRRHGAALQELAQKARADIAAARSDIQRLSTQEPGNQAIVAASAAIAEEGQTEDQTDADEEKLRTQLQGILQTCAGSLGVTIPAPADVQTIASDDDHDGERAHHKRPRSVEPGAGHTTK